MPNEKNSKLQEDLNWYLSLVVLFLFIVVPPILCSLFYLSRVPDITFGGDGDLTYSRIWMYRESRPVGIAYESRRLVERYSETEVCVQNDLRFFLWGESRKAEPATSRSTMEFLNGRWQRIEEGCR